MNGQLTAKWRLMSEQEIQNLPQGQREAKSLGLAYFYPGKDCGEHMALIACTSYKCVRCRDVKRIKVLERNARNITPIKIEKTIRFMGLNIAINKMRPGMRGAQI